MSNLNVAANTVAAIAAIEVLFLTFGKFIIGREAFFAVSEQVCIMLLIQFIALCIMLFILVRKEIEMPSKETLKKLTRAAGNAFGRALKARGLYGKHYVEVYHRDGDTYVDFVFVESDGTLFVLTLLIVKIPRKYKDLEDDLFESLMEDTDIQSINRK